jgi:threonine dehydrogenase-like Zn-dependent dehydrogenase
VLGAGTIALLVAQFALARGAMVHVLGLTQPSLDFARTLGVHGAWTAAQLPAIPFDAIIDCSTGAGLPAAALDLIEPGQRIVFVGLSAEPSLIDTRTMVLKDVTAVGILSASPALDGVITDYASGSVDPCPLVAATVGLGQVGDVLAGSRPAGAGPGPKIHVDPRL